MHASYLFRILVPSYMNQSRFKLVLLAMWTGASSVFADLELVRVWPGYRDAASFTSASEYFQGPAAKAELTVRRTSPEHRAGYYWLVRTKTDTTVAGAKIRLEVTRQGDTEPQLHEFDLDLNRGNHAVPIGLTGLDWPDPAEVPIAWRLTVLSDDGSSLASQSSFLWQDPNR
ncbi:MAG: hypothetical protein HOH58_01895 [Opitutaceae bacterium]|nr:hypothetical protein [Opitutaceae bacterium]